MGGTPLSLRPTFPVSCKASSLGCSDPIDLWLDLLDILSCDPVAALLVSKALHVDSFDWFPPFFLP
jgi:hypothetical protein